MKKIFIKSFLPIFLISLSISAQEFDRSFLDSLPETVKQDLLEQKTSREALEEVQYRRPSSFIKKPDPTSERFGSNVFSMMQSSLMPLNEPNFDSTYVLDFGDVLELQLTGQNSITNLLNIKRDGSINVPEIGKIFLSGLSLDEASNIIKNKVETSYIGTEAFITLVSVRDIQVILAGNIYNPGSYTLNGNSNIFHALSVAGGPSEGGSFRSINLVRNNKVIESIDLYDTFIEGTSSFQTRLRSGDIVFVKPTDNIISISGAVKRPGIYELKEGESLSKVIHFANGISKNIDPSSMILTRITNGEIERKLISDLSLLESIPSSDGDSIFLREHIFRGVIISGSVRNPGAYSLKEGDGILDLINLAGGYTKNAYPFGGVLENLNTRRVNTEANQKLYESFLNDFFEKSSSKIDSGDNSALITSLMGELKAFPPSGRVKAEFDLKVLENDPTKDTILQSGDKIIIPELNNQVYVYGEVQSEGATKFIDDNEINYYIDISGGFRSNADKESVFVIHPNGDTRFVSFKRNIFVNSNKTNIEIYPGSVIFIPRKTSNDFLRLQSIQSYAALLSSFGISLASISVLKD